MWRRRFDVDIERVKARTAFPATAFDIVKTCPTVFDERSKLAASGAACDGMVGPVLSMLHADTTAKASKPRLEAMRIFE